MEKNYKWKVMKGVNSDTIDFGWTETLGQAIVMVKHVGHNLDLKGEQPKNYFWRVVDYTDPEIKGDIDTLEGTYDVEFFPLIKEIQEYK